MSSQLSILQEVDQTIELDGKGSMIRYFPNYLDKSISDKYFSILLNEIEWDDTLRSSYGHTSKFNRKSSYYSQSGYPYPFSGRTFEGKAFTSTMDEILKSLKQKYNYDFNSILFNYYRDGKDTISWHTDNEKVLGQDPTVGTLSFGQERPFMLRERADHSVKREFISSHGSLIIMEGKTQNHWDHSVPQRMKLSNPRLSLTLRTITIKGKD